MKKTTKILFSALLAALFFDGCGAEPTTPPVSENDAALVTAEASSTNIDGAEITADIPQGIYVTGEEPQEITFSWDTGSACTLHWTSNCSTPTAEDKISENGTVELTYKDTGDGASYQSVIRCALFENNEQVSDVYTFVYTHAAEDRFTMPVVSIVSDKRNFYDPVKGILVAGKLSSDVAVYGNPAGWKAGYNAANYFMRGIEWERPIALAVFDELGNLQLSQNCGVRVSGGYTRTNIQKSLRIYARKDYTPDTGVFPYSFWGAHRGSQTGTPVSFSDTVLFRGGSNSEQSTLFTTPSLLLLLEGTYVDAPAIQTVVEYINGAYKGVVTQLEDFDEDYFLVHYGVEKENLTTMKGSVATAFEAGGWNVDDGPEEERTAFYDMLRFIMREKMTEPENYEKACEMIDIRNFIEYTAFQAFIGNTDWPQNNMRAWRYNGNDTEGGYDPDAGNWTDGRWRFLAKDLDLSFGYHNTAVSSNPYEYMKGSCSLFYKNLYCSLIKNKEFADLYYTYMCTLAGEVMSYERCEEVFDLMQVYTGREVAYSAKNLGVAGSSRGNWNSSFYIMRQYALARGPAILRFTKSETKRNLSDITVNIEGNGTVQLGWYDIDSGAARSYLRDTRIPLDALPDDVTGSADIQLTGGHFDEDGYLIADDAECVVTVTFSGAEEETIPSTVVLNEVKFRDTETEWIELYNPTDEKIVLSGYSLGKSGNVSKAHEIAATVLEPGGYALICCTDYANSARIEGLRAAMSLGNGDTLTLFDETGTAVDTMLLETPSKTVHLGRYPDGGEVIQLSSGEATPGAANIRLEYEGPFTSDNFDPYLLAWGRAYELDDYFYEKDGVTWVDREALYELCRSSGPTATLTLWLKKEKTDMTLDELVAQSDEMDGVSVRYVRALSSVIIG